MIHQVLMGCGDSSVKLMDSAPIDLRLKPFLRDHIVITPNRLDPASLTSTELLAQARHTFRIDDIADRTTFSGPSLLAWLGDGDSTPKGVSGFNTAGPKTFTQFVTGIFNSTAPGGITQGTAYGSSGTSVSDTFTFAKDSMRGFFERLREVVGDEFRVNPDGSFDWGQPHSLWKYGASKDLLLSATCDGDDVVVHGLEAAGPFTIKESGKSFANGQYATDGRHTATTLTSGTCGLNGTGATIIKAMTVSDATAWTTSPDAADTVEITCPVNTRDIGRYLTSGQPGDYVYLYAPKQGLWTDAHQITFRGECLFPLTEHRVIETTWPVGPGFGVYHLASNDDQAFFAGASNTVTDWSDYVDRESGPTTLVLGTQRRMSLRQAIAA